MRRNGRGGGKQAESGGRRKKQLACDIPACGTAAVAQRPSLHWKRKVGRQSHGECTGAGEEQTCFFSLSPAASRKHVVSFEAPGRELSTCSLPAVFPAVSLGSWACGPDECSRSQRLRPSPAFLSTAGCWSSSSRGSLIPLPPHFFFTQAPALISSQLFPLLPSWLQGSHRTIPAWPGG